MKRLLFATALTLISTINIIYGQTKEITLEDVWKSSKFFPSGVSGFLPMPQGDFYTVKTDESIDKHSFETGEKVATLLANQELKTASSQAIDLKTVQQYNFDKKEKQLLIAIEWESIYRRSSKAFYYVYNLETKQIQPISDTAKGKQSFATFSYDGKKIAFVRANNLFIKDLENNTEIQVTTDGLDRNIINGMADWVYEEELDMAQAFTWSNDDSKLAYLRFDERRVKEFSMTIWGELYPEEHRFKYPKAGEDNSLVDVYIYDVASRQKTKLDLGDNSNCYFPRIYWLNNSIDLIALKMNRHQNKLEFFRYNTQTEKQDLVYTDENPYWLNVSDDYYFLEDNKSMIVTSERGDFNHIFKVDFGGKITQLTSGNWGVASISSVDFKNKKIYYLSNESNVLNRDLYCIDFNGKNKKMLTDGKGWNVVTFSPTSSYYRGVFSDMNTPPVYAIYDRNGKMIRMLNDNAKFKATMEEYGFVKKEHFAFRAGRDYGLDGWMMKPKDFDTNKKYPVLMYVYGGPGSQEVNNSYFRGMDFAWYQMLTQKGYIVVCVDGRGTRKNGNAFEKCIYKQMGKLETIDQITAANYLKSLPYVDNDRVGIWGWSFGGYLSSLAMFTGKNVFKMAIAVAPVTTWRYYDNIYTERFLRMPQENPDGYDDNSPITHAAKLNGAYLLIHGTADDNVHFQNAMDLATALNNAEKQYEQFFYPNKNHFIYGGNTRFHLYVKLTDFILKNL